MKYDLELLKKNLESLGARFNESSKEINITRPKKGVVGIGTLGKLSYFSKKGYRVDLPQVEYNPRKGYRGLSRP